MRVGASPETEARRAAITLATLAVWPCGRERTGILASVSDLNEICDAARVFVESVTGNSSRTRSRSCWPSSTRSESCQVVRAQPCPATQTVEEPTCGVTAKISAARKKPCPGSSSRDDIERYDREPDDSVVNSFETRTHESTPAPRCHPPARRGRPVSDAASWRSVSVSGHGVTLGRPKARSSA